ncbi:MAG: hypothetical protein ACTHNW_07120 [Mucilaginibacter sp.]
MSLFRFIYLSFAFLAILVATSCQKASVTPSKSSKSFLGNSSASTTKTDTGTTIPTDVLIHHVTFSAPPQFAAVSVSGTQLNVTYYENIVLLIPKQGVTLSYAIHLKEDFSFSTLVNYQFNAYNAYGNVTHEWIDDNLNNVAGKTVKDTTINDTLKEKITLQRPFLFSKSYATSQAAIAGRDSLLARTKDNIVFSSYIYFTSTYPTTYATSNLYYVKTN